MFNTTHLHFKYLKSILGFLRRTNNGMPYLEFGRYSLENQIKNRIIGYSERLDMGNESKLSRVVHHQLQYLSNDD